MSEWTTRKARKAHRCDFCGEEIPAGAAYRRIRLTPWDHPDNDGFLTWRAHPFCEELWQEVGPDWDWEWCDDPGAWRDAAEEYFPTRTAEFPFDRDCRECDGSGQNDEGDPASCPKCDGTGSAFRKARTPPPPAAVAD